MGALGIGCEINFRLFVKVNVKRGAGWQQRGYVHVFTRADLTKRSSEQSKGE
jgi:hypothetical protein